jgi:hypothetical protein
MKKGSIYFVILMVFILLQIMGTSILSSTKLERKADTNKYYKTYNEITSLRVEKLQNVHLNFVSDSVYTTVTSNNQKLKTEVLNNELVVTFEEYSYEDVNITMPKGIKKITAIDADINIDKLINWTDTTLVYIQVSEGSINIKNNGYRENDEQQAKESICFPIKLETTNSSVYIGNEFYCPLLDANLSDRSSLNFGYENSKFPIKKFNLKLDSSSTINATGFQISKIDLQK